MILARVQETLCKFKMLADYDKVLVAVSGGADSLALLHILNNFKKKQHLALHVAHLNHMLRPREADKDEDFVRNLAGKLSIPAIIKRVDVAGYAKKKKLSIEEAARWLRYEFLLNSAREISASKIALGHNRDDQSETVLMRFLRGSGISGLRGIPATRKLKHCLIVRPLIDVGRPQILQFLKQKKYTFRTDSSNLSDAYSRNRIRNRLLPLLEKEFNPNIRDSLVRFAENIRADFNFLELQGKAAFDSVAKPSNAEEVKLDSKKLLLLHEALQKLVVRLAIEALLGNVRGIDYRHWKELEDLLVSRPEGSVVDLPGGLCAVKKSREIIFYKRTATTKGK